MPAILDTTTPSAVPVYPGANLAPIEPLEAKAGIKLEPTKSTLVETVKALYDNCINLDEEPRREIINIGKMVANLTTGKLLLLRHPLDQRYTFVKRDTRFNDHKTVGGLFQYYRTKLNAEWLGSRPARDPICPSDDDRIEEFISAVKVVQDHYDRTLYDDRYETQESHSAQEYGTWITRYRWDEDRGDIVLELLPFPACAFDLRYRPEESPYFIYQQKCATNRLSKMVGYALPSDGNEADDTSAYGLRIIEEIARQGGGVSGEGQFRLSGDADSDRKETIVTEFWLAPEMYCDVELNERTKTVSGETLPAGTMMAEAFPDGLVAIGIDSMNTVLAIYPENKQDHIVSGVYHLQSFSGVGKGISDAIDVKKEMDDLHSQAMAYIKTRGTPAFGYNSDLISEETARNIGKPRKNIPISFKNAPEGVTNINQAIGPIQPMQPASGVFEYGKQLENYLQMAFQVTAFSDGMPGVNNETATGAQIGDANQRTLLVPQHRNKADHRLRADKVIYNLFKRFAKIPKWFATNDVNGITKGRYISGDEFADVDIEFQVVADSEVPKTPYSKEESMSRMFQFTGGLAGIMESAAMNPELAGAVVQAYGVDLPIAKTTDIARVCRKRVDQLKKFIESEQSVLAISEAVTGMPSDLSGLPEQAVAQVMPPIMSKEPFHQQKVAWLAALLDLDEMMDAPVLLRDSIGAMISKHIEMDSLNQIEAQQAVSLAQTAGQLPQVAAQQMMADEQMAQQAQMGQEQMMMEAAQAEQQKAMESENAEMERTEGRIDAERDHERQMQLEAMRQLGSMATSRQPQARKAA